MVTCSCNDGSMPAATSCTDCTQQCLQNGVQSCTDSSNVMGMTAAAFVLVVILYLVVFAVMIVWSIRTMERCRGNPSWLKPTLIVLLVLWIVAFPLSPLIFVALLIILLIYSRNCHK